MEHGTPPHFRIAAPGRRICFWGAPAAVANPAAGSLAQRLQATGANTGNMMIGHGLFHGLEAASKAYHPGFGEIPPERLHERFDAVFIPASNFVSRSVDLTDQADYFARTRLPLICFGLGSQLLPGEPVALKPGTERFLHLVAERSGAIGVRGTFTAEVLWTLGIRNVSVVGCPSLLSLRPATLDRLAAQRPGLEKVALGFSNNVRQHAIAPDAMRAGENALFQRMLGENAFYVLQNETTELDLLAAMERGDTEAVTAAAERVAALFGVSADRPEVRRFLETRIRVFFSVEEWVGCTRTMSAAIGSRFHGNIAALLAGTPALFLVHDMRTLELCELLRVPHLVLDRPRSAEEMLERLLGADYGPFRAQFRRLLMEWRIFLARNGLEVAPIAGERTGPALPEPANAELDPALSA
ncbi:MAG TPA: polysaccharide pyruvyl transferase family protein [Crenalkalicoccus sp.]|nr:polysaccharide pyruvyl transferase family protein [Crenalkalicoccus sp.]